MASRAPRTHARTPAPARTRGLTPSKAAAARRLAASKPLRQPSHAEILASIGPNGGLITRRSSPVLFWLADMLNGIDVLADLS